MRPHPASARMELPSETESPETRTGFGAIKRNGKEGIPHDLRYLLGQKQPLTPVLADYYQVVA